MPIDVSQRPSRTYTLVVQVNISSHSFAVFPLSQRKRGSSIKFAHPVQHRTTPRPVGRSLYVAERALAPLFLEDK